MLSCSDLASWAPKAVLLGAYAISSACFAAARSVLVVRPANPPVQAMAKAGSHAPCLSAAIAFAPELEVLPVLFLIEVALFRQNQRAPAHGLAIACRLEPVLPNGDLLVATHPGDPYVPVHRLLIDDDAASPRCQWSAFQLFVSLPIIRHPPLPKPLE